MLRFFGAQNQSRGPAFLKLKTRLRPTLSEHENGDQLLWFGAWKKKTKKPTTFCAMFLQLKMQTKSTVFPLLNTETNTAFLGLENELWGLNSSGRALCF